MTQQKTDAVDRIVEQWARERPDLDLGPMATIGRLKRCAALIERQLNTVFSDYDLTLWEFDVLATLRRAGAPHCLPPTELFQSLMVTSGTMTHRMQRLEARGLVERLDNPNDARSKLVQLSAKGLAVIDKAVEAHVANQHQLLAPLAAKDAASLDTGLIALLAVLDSTDT